MAFDVRRAAREEGCFVIRHPLFPPERCEETMALGRRFFSLPTAEKKALSIAGSAHFRGYSEMKNERDWREQIHFGREERAADGGPDYRRLLGPNRWPAEEDWQARVLVVLRDLERVGREVVAELGDFLPEEETPYVLLKMIHYHASPGGTARPGVAAHVDFSWITLLLQDSAGGLEYRTPAGEWRAATPQPGTILVNLGEILQFATGGYYQATPHRVTTGRQPRLSMPFFLSPSLDRVVRPEGAAGHVHRVLADAPLHFGEEEWKRKGLGLWCGTCC
ncbi:MAG TPA: 2OG-Fe(II) oxygenase family protein [Bryobacteraceae bacterium]|nr:2OG-Fe(II) oxygenase family protein [Bryobacteraceae bacterium]